MLCRVPAPLWFPNPYKTLQVVAIAGRCPEHPILCSVLFSWRSCVEGVAWACLHGAEGKETQPGAAWEEVGPCYWADSKRGGEGKGRKGHAWHHLGHTAGRSEEQRRSPEVLEMGAKQEFTVRRTNAIWLAKSLAYRKIQPSPILSACQITFVKWFGTRAQQKDKDIIIFHY